MKKYILLLSLIIILIIVACSQKKIKNEEMEKKVISMAQKAEIKTLDPQKATDSVSMSVIHLINKPLFSIDNNGNIIMEIAENFKEIDGKNTLIKIKNNLFFSNGEPLTVDDVIFSLNRARNIPSKQQDFYMIEDIEKVDDMSLKIKTFFESGNLIHKLASTGASIIHKKSFEKDENNIIGSAMFKLKSWVLGEKLILERNTYYKDTKSNISEIIIKFVPEANSRAIMLETSEIDISKDLLPLDFRRLKEDNNIEAIEYESPSNMFLGFDLRNSFLTDRRVRQAIAYSINNQDLVDVVFQGSASVANSPVPKITSGHNENSNFYEQNLQKAKELLTEAGYPNGFDIELFVNEDNQRVDMAVIIQDSLKKIGINAQIKIFQWAAYISMIENKELVKPIFLLSWNIANDDPEEVLYPLYHSSQIDAHTNVVFYKNEIFDKIILDARYSLDKNKRIVLYKEAQDLIQEDLPHYTLVYPKFNFAYRKNIDGIKINKRGYFDFGDAMVE